MSAARNLLRSRCREEPGHLRDRLVHRRGDDVRRHLPGQLDDVLTEVGLHDLHALRFERGVEVDLLGGHRLRLDHEAHGFVPGDVEHHPPGVLRAGRPVHRDPEGFELRLEAVEPPVEIGQHLAPDGRPPLPALHHVGVGAGGRALGAQRGRDLGQRGLQVGIVDRPLGPFRQGQTDSGFRVQAGAHRSALLRSSATWTGSGP
jgi:hypothetical protein